MKTMAKLFKIVFLMLVFQACCASGLWFNSGNTERSITALVLALCILFVHKKIDGILEIPPNSNTYGDLIFLIIGILLMFVTILYTYYFGFYPNFYLKLFYLFISFILIVFGNKLVKVGKEIEENGKGI